MQAMSIGAGLAALAFWGFVTIVSVAGIWGGIRKREAQHETLRRTIESGQALDPKLAEKILSQGRDRLDLDLKVAGLITLFIAPGIAILGWFLSFVSPEATMPLYGAAVLTGFVSAGLLLASRAIERSDKEDESNFGR